MVDRITKSIYIPGTLLAGICLVLLFLATIQPVEWVEASHTENDLAQADITRTLFLPLVARPKTCILSGRTTLNGSPTSVVLGLTQLITINIDEFATHRTETAHLVIMSKSSCQVFSIQAARVRLGKCSAQAKSDPCTNSLSAHDKLHLITT